MRWGHGKKAWQWMEYGKIDAEKIGRIAKSKKHKTNRKKQYSETLKQTQGNPAKQNTKEN
jgi:hypothetical protein